MECPNCRSENKDDSRYCSNCATPLNVEEILPASLTQTVATPLPVVSMGALIAGKYKVLEEIGRGGMGVVFKAEDIKLQRKVALKFLPTNLSESAELRERFLIEARAAAALSHPNICVIHEVGESEGRSFIAMEYVEGETLRDRIKKKPLTNEDVLAITGQIAAGLGEAHHKRIVHRDIKSANIMVTAKGQAKVMDFGLAKLRGGSSLTKSQTTLGTVAYMSPEQARGDEVDGRSDLWSLGVILYEMLTGELPFKGDRDLSIIHSIIHEDPQPIKLRRPPVPQELQKIVGRSLKKNRDARYGSAEEILNDLRSCEAALQAEASGIFNLRSFLKRLRRPAVAIPMVLAMGAIAAAAVLFFNRQAKIRWAREEILPEVERLVGEGWRDSTDAYRLAVQAERYIPDDLQLVEFFSKYSLKINIKTEPSGADVYMKDYDEPASDWEHLGVSPIEGLRVPVGIFRCKFEKEGYETVLAATSSWDIVMQPDNQVVPYDLVRVLDEKGSIPEGMVRVPGTETPIGKLEDFFIDRYEVTNAQYKRFVDAGGYGNREYWKHPFVKEGRELAWEETMAGFVDQTGRPGPSTWQAGGYPEGQDDYPVGGVSWYEAAAFAEFAGKSLPTGYHWGVARGDTTPMIMYYQLGGAAIFVPFSNFQGKGPVPVGSLQGITPYGVYDMAGNVREWCSNETRLGRLFKGGAWNDNTYMFGYSSNAPAFDRSPQNGFRCVLYPKPETIPDAAFGLIDFSPTVDVTTERPVTDSIFAVYKEQFAYDRTDLDSRLESRDESSKDWIKERVTFNAAYGGERVIAVLYLPRNAEPPFQTVVYFPGAQAAMRTSSTEIENDLEFQVFLSFLVKNGRAVVYPVYKGTMERASEELMPIVMGFNNASYQFTEYMTEIIKDFRRCIDYLETRQDIESDNLGYYGMSWGAWMGAYIPAVEDRLKASILVAGGIDLVNARPRPEVSETNYVPRVKIPTLMLNGRYDSFSSYDKSIKPMFDMLGTPAEHKVLKLYDTDHIPPRNEFVKEILAWLDKYLGLVKR
jgi:dienelactone hydrolase/predicted Ser/Thr protein kinase